MEETVVVDMPDGVGDVEYSPIGIGWIFAIGALARKSKSRVIQYDRGDPGS